MCHTLLDSGHIMIKKIDINHALCGPHSVMGKIQINT